MRVIGELPHPEFKITLFHWNNRYLVKIEQGFLEQTFKIDEFEIEEKNLFVLIDEVFLKQVSARFADMAKTFREALQRVENQIN